MIDKLYTREEIARIHELSVSTIRNRAIALNIIPEENENGAFLYTEDQAHEILVNGAKQYYPIKLHDVFYIYESKINS